MKHIRARSRYIYYKFKVTEIYKFYFIYMPGPASEIRLYKYEAPRECEESNAWYNIQRS